MTMLCLLLLMATVPSWAQYAMPVVPDTVVGTEARADYAALHYWERFDFGDASLRRKDYGEQAVANFLGLLGYAGREAQRRSIEDWMGRAAADGNGYRYFVALAEKYLMHAQSPLRNERLYGVVARHAGQCEQAETIMPFDGGNDGERMVLLVFYDPDCEECRTLLFQLRNSSVLRQWQAEGRLEVRLLDVGDARTPLDDYRQLDFSQTPAMFLVSGKGRVLLHQPDFRPLTSFLMGMD